MGTPCTEFFGHAPVLHIAPKVGGHGLTRPRITNISKCRELYPTMKPTGPLLQHYLGAHIRFFRKGARPQ